jgi:hypothetical protein
VKLVQPGEFEPLKLAVHGGMLVGAALCAAYNIGAFVARREPHNAVNAALYTGLVALELSHVAHHWAAVDEASTGRV